MGSLSLRTTPRAFSHRRPSPSSALEIPPSAKGRTWPPDGLPRIARRQRRRAKQPRNPPLQPIPCRLGFHRAGPDGDDVPAESGQGGLVAGVAGAVAFDLRPPPVAARLRQAEVRAVLVAVPEAAVDEDDGPVLRQDEVGPAGEPAVPRAADGEAIAQAVEHRADDELRPGIAAADARHQRGALVRGENIGHGTREPGIPPPAMKSPGASGRRRGDRTASGARRRWTDWIGFQVSAQGAESSGSRERIAREAGLAGNPPGCMEGGGPAFHRAYSGFEEASPRTIARRAPETA